ncbi:apolipoprotein D and lipocalin family protein [Pseudomonas duriflava]|uniref:Outer membrane lipoprotein Blc n=1 Tax=Pseudomonas duriflava TaxID=459528 RepID=A0A562QBK6_9PSED|nr:lipocalin family protein [Pseudomonas duriflava]TWI54145.1 apolipoprotein D and lipocalin family protein [Pseudomonas duriflava]
MKASTKWLFLAGAVGLLAACASASKTSAPPATVGALDLDRYQGTWYEWARLPMFFQRNCVESEAHYRLRSDGRIDVLNRCQTRSGEWDEATGIAAPIAPGVTDRLEVRFDTWFSGVLPNVAKGPYWVLYVDPDYQTALVGSPDRKYLWLLARQPNVMAAPRDTLLRIAHEKGYDTAKLVWRGETSSQ